MDGKFDGNTRPRKNASESYGALRPLIRIYGSVRLAMANFWPKFENFPRQGPSQEPNRISLIVEKLSINVVIFDSENNRKRQQRYKTTTKSRRKSHLKKTPIYYTATQSNMRFTSTIVAVIVALPLVAGACVSTAICCLSSVATVTPPSGLYNRYPRSPPPHRPGERQFDD